MYPLIGLIIDVSIIRDSFAPSLVLPRWGERSEGGEAGQNLLPSGEGREGVFCNGVMFFWKTQ